MKRYFIVGTDTDCGKTYATCKLLNYFPNTVAIKPVASGCDVQDSDARQLQKNNNYNLSLDAMNPWRFKLPVSPHLAAEAEGVRLSIAQIADYCMTIQCPGIDRLLIEGAGGLMVPLNREETWIDFLKVTQIPVILVVGMKLGCINHALLTEASLAMNHINCLGWIANCIDPKMKCMEENIETLIHKLKVPLLTSIDFSGAISEFSVEL